MELSSCFRSSGFFFHIHFIVETTSLAQPGRLIQVFLLGNLMTSSSVCKPPTHWSNISEDNRSSSTRVVAVYTNAGGNTVCQSWGARVDAKSPASTAGPDFRLAGLIFEEISHSRAMKVRLCVAESVFTVQGLAWVARIL